MSQRNPRTGKFEKSENSLKPVSFTILPELLEKVDKVSECLNVSRSHFICKALENALQDDNSTVLTIEQAYRIAVSRGYQANIQAFKQSFYNKEGKGKPLITQGIERKVILGDGGKKTYEYLDLEDETSCQNLVRN